MSCKITLKNVTCSHTPVIIAMTSYSSTYYDVVNVHQLECPDYPVSCPNSCEVRNLKRCDIDEHRFVCLKEMVSCSFSDMGCKEQIKWQDLPEHIKANMLLHQSMMCDAFRGLKRENRDMKMEIEAMCKAEATPEYWINGYK